MTTEYVPFIGEEFDMVSTVIRANRKKPTFTIMALLYGDYPDLAKRCLDSILVLPDYDRWELRIGCNAISDRTRRYLLEVEQAAIDKGANISRYDSSENRGKYPMMRWMLNDPSCGPLDSKYIMWFDDDSYIKTPTKEWLDELEAVMQNCDMCGQQMRARLMGGQPTWITTQPWYNGKPVNYMDFGKVRNCPVVPSFAVGGWWVARHDMLKALNWPTQNIIHRGGDYMLGEAMRQHGYKLTNYRKGVVINAAIGSDVDVSSPRRGMNPLPVGADYVPQTTVLLHEATKSIPAALLDYPNI